MSAACRYDSTSNVPLGANFSRFRLARLQAESSRNMYSEQGLLALMRAVVAHRDQRVRLGLFLGLAVDEVHDVGMVNVEDDHLGSAPRLATGLDDAGEGVKALHEAERTAGRAAAAQAFRRRPQRREV